MTNRQKMTWRLLLGLALSVGLGAALLRLSSTSQATAAPDPTQNLLNVRTRSIKLVDHIIRTRDFTGDIKAARESQLSFERPGRIIAVLVDEGDEVVAGQLLATIDVDQVVANVASVEAQLDQATALLQELVTGPRKETIAAARAKVASLEAEAKRLQLDFDRAERLLKTGSVSKEIFDQKTYSRAFAQAQRDEAQEKLDELLAGTRAERIEAQRAVVKQLAADIRTLQLDMADGQLTSPYAGRIAERFLDEGTVVAAGNPAFRLVEESRLEAWVGIPPSSGKSLSAGETYRVHVEGSEVEAKLISLRPSLDAITRTQNAIFQLMPAEDDRLVPGQIVRLSIKESVAAEGFALPTTALTPGPRDLWNAFVVVSNGGNSIVEKRDAELLYSMGDQALVRGTLQTGDEVVLDGVHRVVAGQKVSLEPQR